MDNHQLNFSNYLSLFSWRYGSKEMRYLFSEKNKFLLWRKLWLTLAKIQYQANLISKEELEDLEKNEKNLDIQKILVIENEVKHDVVAAIKEYGEKAKKAAGKIHLGATSMDITDNTDILRIKEGLNIIKTKLKETLSLLSKKIKTYASFPCLGYTHLQPAEPTTVGYRLAFYAQDFFNDLKLLSVIEKDFLRAKGFRGAVGTGATYKRLLAKKEFSKDWFDKMTEKFLGIKLFPIVSQVYPRKLDYLILIALSSIGQSAAKFTADLRLLQSPFFGEWQEPFSKNQVGSSAMPFKKNPIIAENTCSLARYLVSLTHVAWENAALSFLERTLDDSANRRLIIPEAFLATDQILINLKKIISQMVFNEKRITDNLNRYAPFFLMEVVMVEAVKRGANRQKIHEILRQLALFAWKKIEEGKDNPLVNLLIKNRELNYYLKPKEIASLLALKNYIGHSKFYVIKLLQKIKKI